MIYRPGLGRAARVKYNRPGVMWNGNEDSESPPRSNRIDAYCLMGATHPGLGGESGFGDSHGCVLNRILYQEVKSGVDLPSGNFHGTSAQR